MQKGFVIGILIILLIVVGGIFLLLGQTEPKSDLGESESDTVPTQWSQAGDYEIKETPGQQTVVTNSKAGFSFKVPEGWRVNGEKYGIEEYILNLLSLDAQLNERKSLTKGCGISFGTLYQKDEVANTKASIVFLQDNGGEVNSGETIQTIIKISGHFGVKIINTTDDQRFLETFGRITQVKIPVDDATLIVIGFSIMPVAEKDCTAKFDTLLSNLVIK
ncbi:MAG: hypothetical protein HYU04_01630 [Candidatus Wildermuthbacteria bacterium]|nr:hypothetical protein [Candidatus Wildermuthbacteria bacterium]